MYTTLSHITTNALDVPSKWRGEPKRPFEAPKWRILYTPGCAPFGILHSIVASLRALSLAGLDHLNRRQKSSSSYTGSQLSVPWSISTKANVPSVMRSFLGQAETKTTLTMSPLLYVAFLGTSDLASPKFEPIGAMSKTTGGRKPSCLLRRSGGCGPGSTLWPWMRAVASFLNSWMKALRVCGPYRVDAPYKLISTTGKQQYGGWRRWWGSWKGRGLVLDVPWSTGEIDHLNYLLIREMPLKELYFSIKPSILK